MPAVGCGALAIPGSLLAADQLSQFQHDPAEFWGARILAWALAAGVVLVLYTLVKVLKDELNGVRGKALLLAGIVLLPSFSVATGMLLVFIRAERVEFCASCHVVMQDYAEDMTDEDGTGLAAVHFVNRYIPTNQCYQCHTSYGLFGTVEAKIHGVGEVVRYYSGSYSKPISMWHPYPNRDCLKCHAGSRKWLAVDAHIDDDMQAALFADQTSCMSCHDSAHRVRATIARRIR